MPQKGTLLPDLTIFFDSPEQLAHYQDMTPGQQRAVMAIILKKEGLDKGCIECTLNEKLEENQDA